MARSRRAKTGAKRGQRRGPGEPLKKGPITARILVIEDNPTNLQLVVYLLQAFGHEVSGTKEAAEGIEMARRHKPDLILLDIHMPKMDGYEVAGRLRETPDCRHIPIVAVTALAMVGDREKLLTSGFDGYIAKPIDPESFVDKVDGFLRLPPPTGQPSPRPAAAAVEEQGSQMSRAKRGVLLFVDNSATNLQLARCILEPRGYEVISAPNVQEGIELARRSKPDLIVSDVHMPQQDGYVFIHLVQADPELSQTPFVFLSSTVSSVREQERALAQGATKFLCRPLDPQTLSDELEACLRNRRSH
jgi:two-component system cell cycle response regulator